MEVSGIINISDIFLFFRSGVYPVLSVPDKGRKSEFSVSVRFAILKQNLNFF